MSGAQCDLCQTAAATFLCQCQEVHLCNLCLPRHLRDISTPHRPVALDQAELLQTVRNEVLETQQSGGTTDVPGMSTERRRVVSSLIRKEITRIEAFQEASQAALMREKEKWSMQVENLVKELQEELEEQTFGARDRLEKTLTEVGASDTALEQFWGEGCGEEDELVELTFALPSFDLAVAARSGVRIRAKVSSEREPTPVIYKFFGGMRQVGVFEARTESYSNTISADAKFFHNASACLAPTGLVYLSGGSLTGRSRDEALTFNPATGKVVHLQPMITARRSHASIFIKALCCVFGGLVEDDKSCLCEKYAGEKWESLPKMQERRAYLGACEYGGRVYLAGGSTTCEIFNPSPESFTLLALPNTPLQDNCCLIALPDSLLIFHGDYQGKVSRFYPDTGAIQTLRDMCYGNSWSSCAPVRSGRCVYMLRSESVFKYEWETGESAYVLRISKSPPRKWTCKDTMH